MWLFFANIRISSVFAKLEGKKIAQLDHKYAISLLRITTFSMQKHENILTEPPFNTAWISFTGGSKKFYQVKLIDLWTEYELRCDVKFYLARWKIIDNFTAILQQIGSQ